MPVAIGITSPRNGHDQPRPSYDSLELLYNNAVQSFVRRDHVKTQGTLSRVLSTFKTSQKPLRAWYDLGDGSEEDLKEEEWIIKALKLVISSHASLYSDPPKFTESLDSTIQALLPPSLPSSILGHLLKTCEDTYFPLTKSENRLLPPQLVSTLILASLNLRPLSSTLPFAHNLAESWLADLPDEFISSLGCTKKWSPIDKKRIEGMREGYLKVLELFVGEVLVKEGEWEMARGMLDGEGFMPSKRKEASFPSSGSGVS